MRYFEGDIVAIGSTEHLKGELYWQGDDLFLYDTEGKANALKDDDKISFFEATELKANFSFELSSDGNQYDLNHTIMENIPKDGNSNMIAIRVKPAEGYIKSFDARSVKGWNHDTNGRYPKLTQVNAEQTKFPTQEEPHGTFGIVGFAADGKDVEGGQVVPTIHLHIGSARQEENYQGGHLNEITLKAGTKVEVMYAAHFAIRQKDARVYNPVISNNTDIDKLEKLNSERGFENASLPQKTELGGKTSNLQFSR